MVKLPRRRGFTLVEMLVVIAIIVVLMAILFPVFSSVRAKARKAKCITHFHELAAALKAYKTDHGKYPGMPYYGADGRYHGGFSTLFPDYIDSTDMLICPDDMIGRAQKAATKANAYSSYNGAPVDAAAGNWALSEVYYNYHGYDYGTDAGGGIISTGVDNLGVDDATYKAAIMIEYGAIGRRWRDAPRLENPSAPGNTIVSHCVHHRRDARGKAEEENDHCVRIDGDVSTVKRTYMEGDPDGGSGPKIAPWLSSSD